MHFGRQEIANGLSFVGLSRVPKFENLYIEECSFDRLQSINRSTMLKFRLEEEQRLSTLEAATLNRLLKHRYATMSF